jgi:CubicO group peptidase (beta-lactamase class C family)
MEAAGVPGATLALVRDGTPVWTAAYGMADPASGRPMTPDDLFRVESISKSVTAWGVMTLARDGAIALDDPVARHLDSWTFPGSTVDVSTITIRRLLNHTAGLALGPIGEEYAPGEPIPSLHEHLSRAVRISHEPGTRFQYSNAGYNLLQLVVEDVTGQSFAAYMQAAVLAPLDMHRARFRGTDSLFSEMPTGTERDGTPVAPYTYPAVASGGLLASASDVARFVAAEVSPPSSRSPVLARDAIQQMHAPTAQVSGVFGFVADAYGLGHFVETLPDGRRAVWHGGQGHGWMAHVHAVPATGDGIVILTNSERAWPLMANILDAWAGWIGAESVGMTTITDATTALQGLTALLAIAVLALLVRLLRGFQSGARRLRPFAREARTLRLAEAVAGSAILSALAGSALQPYVFVSSIFPSTIGWTAAVLTLLALSLLTAALFPKTHAPVSAETNGRS